MDILASSDLRKSLNDPDHLRESYGPITAKKISQRLIALKSADNLEVLLLQPGRKFHRLTGNLKGQVGVTLDGGNRMVLRPAGDPTEYMEGENIFWRRVRKVSIISIGDHY